MNREVFTINETCKELKCSRRTVYRMIERGELQRVRYGRSVRILGESIDELTRPPEQEPKRQPRPRYKRYV